MCLIHGKDIPMKKFIAALILTALCFAAGCNNPAVTATIAPSQNPSPSTTTADPTTAPPSASAEQLGTDDPSPSQTLEITSFAFCRNSPHDRDHASSYILPDNRPDGNPYACSRR